MGGPVVVVRSFQSTRIKTSTQLMIYKDTSASEFAPMLKCPMPGSSCDRIRVHELMDYSDAIDEVLERAAQIRLPGHGLDVVTLAQREFAKRGCCDSKLIDPIERTLEECIDNWSAEQKRQIWESTETGMRSEAG